jgi:hypothetical protein
MLSFKPMMPNLVAKRQAWYRELSRMNATGISRISLKIDWPRSNVPPRQKASYPFSSA